VGGSDENGAQPGCSAGEARVACTLTSTLLRRVRTTLGEERLLELLSRSGVPYGADFLEEVGNWIPYDDAVALFGAAAEISGDDQIGQRVGEDAVRQHAGTAVATLLRSLGSPERVYEQVALAATKFSTVTELTPLEVAPGKAVVRARNRLGIARDPLLCGYTRGMLSQPPVLFGLPAALVEESTCAARGDDACLYTATWDAEEAAAAADPQTLITALEAQLAAMRERLESVYASAGDLIAHEDLEGALARITERAAGAVRAPTYLLAVRTGPLATLHVHARGLVDRDPESLADELLGGELDAASDSRLVAEVASRKRHYGRLMAASPAGGFFPTERDLFEVYARYAAAVLDYATALDDARRRHDQSRALLGLSRALAVATTSDEVAERLAQAVPSVVDCDRVVVFLWSDEDEVLACRAATGVRSDDERLRSLEVRPSDTPLLAPGRPPTAPLFFDPDTPDPFMRDVMARFESRAVVVVPIVVRDTFYGALSVVATERPERLDRSGDLMERMGGVVAQAGTALENARLLETMAHQALHDGLTGLLGHRAFQEALVGSVGHAEERQAVTLAMIDIDDFKAINDEHGHPTGDEALRLVSNALRRAVRAGDAVFRVGGEEFAVLFQGVAAHAARPIAERLRAEVERIGFIVPLRVSVGLASWPAHAPDREGLLAVADAALYEAKRAGKNRTAVAGA
jgi:diguanylate cyclase (GGDEF)-like protein